MDALLADSSLWIAFLLGLGLALLASAGILAWNRTLRVKVEQRTLELKRELIERHRAEIALQEARNELEQRVIVRTADLEARNRELSETRRELQSANERLRRLASIDGLTGIANRRQFDEILTREVRRALRERKPLSLLLCDLDGFKLYNDTYGHLQGDESLRQVARAIEQCMRRAGDLVARYGGEEFAVVLPSLDAPEALALAERVRRNVWRMALPHAASPVADRLTLSVGVATMPVNHRYNSEEIIQTADLALYQAKRCGGNRVVRQSQLRPSGAIELVS